VTPAVGDPVVVDGVKYSIRLAGSGDRLDCRSSFGNRWVSVRASELEWDRRVGVWRERGLVMVRVKRANGAWEDLGEPAARPASFTRRDGSRMTQEEVARLGKVDQPIIKSLPPLVVVRPERGIEKASRRKVALDKAAFAWEAVQRLGTQVAAAKELGWTQGSLQTALNRYMKANGIKGPRPGLLPDGHARRVGAKRTASRLSDHDRQRIKGWNESARELHKAGIFDARPNERVQTDEAEVEPQPEPVPVTIHDEPSWWEQARRRYFDCLLIRATDGPDYVVGAYFDRLESLLARSAQ
jgi:hypothetical protein